MCAPETFVEVTLCKARPFSGREKVWVDSCLAPLVQALNDHGVETIGSCCGHGRETGTVVIAQKDGAVVTLSVRAARSEKSR